ncbi:hypothetical protein ACFPQ7_19150, partial [Methylobacterium iners]|uniref:hypothetical protein n=1 Tax=Methylobacterium iners TaxID=418707 RepID=UPI003614F8F2
MVLYSSNQTGRSRIMVSGPALQLLFGFDVSVSCGGLVSPSPERSCVDVRWPDAALGRSHRH